MKRKPAGWTLCHSERTGRDYWYNEETGESRWEDPEEMIPRSSSGEPAEKDPGASWERHWSRSSRKSYYFHPGLGITQWDRPADYSDDASLAIRERIQSEWRENAVDAPDCPRYLTSVDIPALAERLLTERAKILPSSKFEVLFKLPDEDTANITRAFQEDQINKVNLKLRVRGDVIDLKSFWEVWFTPDGALKKEILSSSDPNEEKWKLEKRFNYKIPTTFMPGYAKAIYEHLGAKMVLDPCSGWGDRIAGATASSCVEKYVGFDPNTRLRAGYTKTMQALGVETILFEKDIIIFENGFEIHSRPFEVGALALQSESFDIAFTSPPFFDYEMYNPNNPGYKDWIEEFYVPLVKESARCVKKGGYVGLYIGDTSAGRIEDFLRERVSKITDLTFVFEIGFMGLYSEKPRGVLFYRRAV